MRNHENFKLVEILETEWQRQFEDSRNDLRHQAKLEISKIQQENRKTYNRQRRAPHKYAEGDFIAIKRTQMIPGRKLRIKYLGSYEIVKT